MFTTRPHLEVSCLNSKGVFGAKRLTYGKRKKLEIPNIVVCMYSILFNTRQVVIRHGDSFDPIFLSFVDLSI